MYFALERGADLLAYHDRMYQAALKDRADIEDIGTLADWVRGLLDEGLFREALRSGKFSRQQKEGNRRAFEEAGVWVVPSYRLNGGFLDSIENVGVSQKQLRDFLEKYIV
jgi:predicted DsbA family dithiol-disulfide isomerase